MARMPGANWLGEHGGTLMSHWDIVCVHTIVGFAPAHAAHFSVHGDGRIDQSRDTRFRSAANLNGNHRVIAIENEDHGSPFPSWTGSDVPALTPAQVDANARILRWAHDTHGVPLQLCPNSRPASRGLAYHRQGCDGNFTTYPGRVAGGELWSKAFGKVCPGDRRIAQLPSILAAATGGTTPPGDDDLPYTEQQLHEIIKHAVRTLMFDNADTWRAEMRRIVQEEAATKVTVTNRVTAGADVALPDMLGWAHHAAYHAANAAGDDAFPLPDDEPPPL